RVRIETFSLVLPSSRVGSPLEPASSAPTRPAAAPTAREDCRNVRRDLLVSDMTTSTEASVRDPGAYCRTWTCRQQACRNGPLPVGIEVPLPRVAQPDGVPRRDVRGHLPPERLDVRGKPPHRLHEGVVTALDRRPKRRVVRQKEPLVLDRPALAAA